MHSGVFQNKGGPSIFYSCTWLPLRGVPWYLFTCLLSIVQQCRAGAQDWKCLGFTPGLTSHWLYNFPGSVSSLAKEDWSWILTHGIVRIGWSSSVLSRCLVREPSLVKWYLLLSLYSLSLDSAILKVSLETSRSTHHSNLGRRVFASVWHFVGFPVFGWWPLGQGQMSSARYPPLGESNVSVPQVW